MPAIFISYRRSDGGGYAGRIFDRLRQEFGDGEVFRDVDTIDSGTRFPDAIARQLEDCRVFVVIIGPTWISASDENGARRLDNPRDWVRIEVATALKRNVCIIPVTIGGAAAPAAQDLPEDLRSLADWQRRDLRDGDTWGSDLELLVRRIAKELGFKSTQFKRKAAVALASIALLGVISAASLLFLYRSTPAPTQDSPAAIVIFDNTNRDDVRNSPIQHTYLTITTPHFITKIYTYHWNDEHGSPPGLIRLVGRMEQFSARGKHEESLDSLPKTRKSWRMRRGWWSRRLLCQWARMRSSTPNQKHGPTTTYRRDRASHSFKVTRNSNADFSKADIVM